MKLSGSLLTYYINKRIFQSYFANDVAFPSSSHWPISSLGRSSPSFKDSRRACTRLHSAYVTSIGLCSWNDDGIHGRLGSLCEWIQTLSMKVAKQQRSTPYIRFLGRQAMVFDKRNASNWGCERQKFLPLPSGWDHTLKELHFFGGAYQRAIRSFFAVCHLAIIWWNHYVKQTGCWGFLPLKIRGGQNPKWR